ncbi:uncharacterized protein METZ01_LOCUS113377 [marine metagenome]|uniref:Uncharacterized protein n=1 Tax=marine metagenome TaxID=408172 RepID=A0A381X8G7_9ZZZZ
MTKWKRMRRRQERKRMQEEERKQPTEQEPTLVEETPDDVQISQKNENTETTTNTPKFVISGVKYVYLLVCFALLSGIFYPLVVGEGWNDTLKGIGVLAVGLFGGILLYKSITSEKRRGVLMCCGFGLIAVSLIIIYELIGSPLYQ